MTTVKEFPDVDEDQIELIGARFRSAGSSCGAAKGSVTMVAGTTSWHSSETRPAWDDTLAARIKDMSGAEEVLEHVGNVLKATGSELAVSRQQYNSATMALAYVPDPRVSSMPPIYGTAPPDPNPDPDDIARYEAIVKRANDAVDDAEFLLATCAGQLMAVSNGVTFSPLPTGPQPPAISSGGTIVPFAPAFGTPSGAVYANGIPVQFAKGQKFESDVLRELGIDGGTKDFFRPGNDGAWTLPRTRSGSLYRGSFPDSTRAGILEIKSGGTEITMKSPQIQIQRWISRITGRPWNLITDEDTPVSQDVLDEIEASGGGAYSRVNAGENTYWDRINEQYVRLQGGAGPNGDDLVATPVTAEEKAEIENQIRINTRLEHNLGEEPETPSEPGPSEPGYTQEEYDEEWGKTPIVRLGPGESAPGEEGGGKGGPEEPVEPVEPIEPIEPVEPIEPIIPVEPIVP